MEEILSGRSVPAKPEALPELDRMAAVDTFVGATKAEIQTGGNQPMYVPSQDFKGAVTSSQHGPTGIVSRETCRPRGDVS